MVLRHPYFELFIIEFMTRLFGRTLWWTSKTYSNRWFSTEISLWTDFLLGRIEPPVIIIEDFYMKQ